MDKKAPFSGRKQGDLPEAKTIEWDWNGSEHKSRQCIRHHKLISPQIVNNFFKLMIFSILYATQKMSTMWIT
jgi:hypothetical protein